MLGLSVIILFKSLLHVFCSLVFSAHNSSELSVVQNRIPWEFGKRLSLQSTTHHLLIYINSRRMWGGLHFLGVPVQCPVKVGQALNHLEIHLFFNQTRTVPSSSPISCQSFNVKVHKKRTDLCDCGDHPLEASQSVLLKKCLHCSHLYIFVFVFVAIWCQVQYYYFVSLLINLEWAEFRSILAWRFISICSHIFVGIANS